MRSRSRRHYIPRYVLVTGRQDGHLCTDHQDGEPCPRARTSRIPTHCDFPMVALNPLDQQFDERSWYCPTCGVVNTYMACEAR
jgi:hypothetical protein